MTTREQLREFIDSLSTSDRATLRAMLNGRVSRRTITPEQQAMMQAAKRGH